VTPSKYKLLSFLRKLRCTLFYESRSMHAAQKLAGTDRLSTPFVLQKQILYRITSIVTAPILLARNVPNNSGWLGFYRMWSHSGILFKERCHSFLKAGIRSHGPLDSFLVLATCTLHDMKIYLEWIKVRSHVQSRDGARIY
jgi:hypothetical protein